MSGPASSVPPERSRRWLRAGCVVLIAVALVVWWLLTDSTPSLTNMATAASASNEENTTVSAELPLRREAASEARLEDGQGAAAMPGVMHAFVVTAFRQDAWGLAELVHEAGFGLTDTQCGGAMRTGRRITARSQCSAAPHRP